MASKISDQRFENVACPFCGLLCDDLTIAADSQGRLRVLENGCPISKPAFAGLDAAAAEPRVDGANVRLDQAIARAAAVLRDARQPLIAGLATDVAGMRAAIALADRCGAAVDHMNSAANLRNLAVLQDSGWVTTTFAEIKNRADLVLVIGTDVVSRFPRFFERMIWVDETLFAHDAPAREIIYLGETTAPAGSPRDKATVIGCANADLGEIIGALRCLLGGRPLTADAGGVPLSALRMLAEKISAARYGIAVWSAADLNFPHAELTVQSLCEMLKDLNRTTRFSGLPLGGSDGDVTAAQVSTWQSGYALRTNFSSGYPHYDPYHHSSARLLADNEADALLWISSFDAARVPPKNRAPTIVLGRVGMTFEKEPTVYIPIATPGADHVGHSFRCDNVVALPLRKLRDRGLPTANQILSAIERKLAADS